MAQATGFATLQLLRVNEDNKKIIKKNILRKRQSNKKNSKIQYEAICFANHLTLQNEEDLELYKKIERFVAIIFGCHSTFENE